MSPSSGLYLVGSDQNKPKILFLHMTMFGQFEFLARYLADHGWDVRVAYGGDDPPREENGIRFYTFPVLSTTFDPSEFRYILDYAAMNAYSVAELMFQLRDQQDYTPDIVMAHCGWGVGLCVKNIWRKSKYIAYHEWYYDTVDWSKGGKITTPSTALSTVGLRMRNLPIIAEFDGADANWCPSQFQAGRFPPWLHQKLFVIHDGVDCEKCRPDPEAKIDFDWLKLNDVPHILTYATRGMEPIRGFPQFMRAVALLQKRRDDFHTIIMANDKVSYGEKLPENTSWRLQAIDRLDLDHQRLHFSPMQPRNDYIRLLQASSAHVYFTEPFVTSWSLSEALATGCMVIGSDTEPVTELIEDMETGLICDMDDDEEVAENIEWVFDHPTEAAEIRQKARRHMLEKYDRTHIFAIKEKILRAMIHP